MLCARPFRDGLAEFGCGQCMPCRVNRARLWTGRMMLERESHAESGFATLTYDKEHVPLELQPRDVQLFLKRLRKRVESVRYFAVGEYGDTTFRPHYHVALFGCRDAVAVDESWGLGFTYTGDLTPESARYIAGYVTKKMTSKNDSRLDGRYPEFARMSRHPGIGRLAVEDVAASLTSKGGSGYVAREGDVVSSFRVGGRRWPFGRYLRSKLREDVGVVEDVAQLKYAQWYQELMAEGPEVQELRRLAREGSNESAKARDRIRVSRKGIGL